MNVFDKADFRKSEYKIPDQPFTCQNFINGKYVESFRKKPSVYEGVSRTATKNS
tara:strand:- start:319 stop:480 length:162 start_codon:yes stop_codon:yes gene_type:complete